jgi:methionyl-tRNA synthetase
MTSNGNNKTLILAALPYTNNIPHLGNIIGCVLSADVFSRYLKKLKPTDNILFVGGLDEYGTATEVKARELNISCKDLCDKNSLLHKYIYDWLLINFDCYGRTSQPNGNPQICQDNWPQTKITHEIFKSLCKNKYILELEENVMYSPDLKSYVSDRYVLCTCHHCGFTKSNGDQCDACHKFISLDKVVNPVYNLNPELKLELKSTTNLFIDLDKIWKDHNMTDWIHSRTSWTKVSSSVTEEWLKMGLKPRSITRDLKWGTCVPNTLEFGNRYSEKVFYVWFDAPIGYISITENALGQKASESFWKDPNTKMIHFLAKDNIPFHSIVFPTTLRGSGYSNITNVDIASTDYLLYESKKFSKSRGEGIFCDDMIKISEKYDLLPDYWRAYLIFIRPESGDSNFVLNGEGGFVDFINNILIKNLGNLVHRTLSIAFQIFNKYKIESVIIDKTKMNDDYKDFLTEYITNMNAYSLREGIKTCFKYSSHLNVRFNEGVPWDLLKDENKKDELCDFVMNMYLNLHELANLLEPFVPTIGQKIKESFVISSSSCNEEKQMVCFPKEKPTIMIKQLIKIEYEIKKPNVTIQQTAKQSLQKKY